MIVNDFTAFMLSCSSINRRMHGNCKNWYLVMKTTAGYQKFAKDVAIIGLTNLLLVIKGLILLPILVKNLGTANYGIWAQVGVTLSLLLPITTLQLGFGFSRFLAGKTDLSLIQEHFYSILVAVILWATVLIVVLMVFSVPIATFLFRDARFTIIVELMAIMMILDAIFHTFMSYFRAFRQMIRYSLLIMLQNLGEIALVLVVVFLGYDIVAVIMASLIMRAMATVLAAALIIAQIKVKVPKFSNVLQYASFTIPHVPGGLSNWILSSSDRYFLVLFISITAVGIYSAAYRVGTLVIILVMPIAFVLPPVLSHLYEEGRITEVQTYLSYSLKYVLMLAMPAVVGLMVISEPLLLLLTTPEIVKHGVVVIPLVALSALLYCIYVPFVNIFNLIKKTKIVGSIQIASALVNVTLNIIFIPLLGMLGAAMATLVAYLFMTATCIYYSRRYLIFPIDFLALGKSFIAAILMGMVIHFLNPKGISGLFISVGVGVITYGAFILVLGGVNDKERTFIVSLFSKVTGSFMMQR